MTLLIHEQPLQVIPSLAKEIGLDEALVLQQIHFWLDPKKDISFFDGIYWLEDIYDLCLARFCMWDQRKIHCILRSLEEEGYLIFIQRGTPRREYVTIDYDALPLASGEPHQFRDCGPDYLINPSAPRGTGAVSLEDKADMPNLKKRADSMIAIWNDPAHTYLQPEDPASLTTDRAHNLVVFLMSQWLLEGIPWAKYCQEANRIGSQEKNQNNEEKGVKPITLDWALIPENAATIVKGIRKDKS